MKLYGMPLSTRVNKVRMCAYLIGKDFEFEHINLYKKEHKTPEFLAMNVMGKIPVIDNGGFILSESNSIMRYLVSLSLEYRLYPTDVQKRAEIDRWLDYVSMHVDDGINRIMFNKFVAPKVGVNPSERSVKEGVFMVEAALPVIELQLENHPFIAGEEMTIADIGLLSTLDPLEILDIDITPYQALRKWQEHMKKNDFYSKTHISYKDAFEKYMKSMS